MKNRSPVAVCLLPLITFGIYGLVWEVQTKNEMNKLGADIPTAWLLIVPIVNFWWMYKYCLGVEKVTGGKMSAVMSLVLLLLLSVIGMAIIQTSFNEVAGGGTAPAAPTPTPPADTTPPTVPIA